MKTIVIDGKNYDIDCNAFSAILHRRIFNKGMTEEINTLKDYMITQTLTSAKLKEENPQATEVELSAKLSEIMTKKVDDFVETITRITYTLICCANENMVDYDTFLKGIKKLNIDDDWIVEVTELAVDCFC